MSDRSPRILICRLSAVGDCIQTLPVLCALRRHFPRAFIGWIVSGAGAQLLHGHACLDELIVVPRRWIKSLRGIREVRARLRKFDFETALDVQSLSKSALPAWLSGARRRIGFTSGQGREIAPWLNNLRVRPRKDHVIDRYLELLAPLGITSPPVEYQLPRESAAELLIDQFLTQSHLTCDYAVLNPGAGWDSKLWPARRYGHVARHLGEQRGVPSLVVWAGPREKQWAEQIVAGSGGHAIMAPDTMLPQLAEVLRRACLFIGSDTGPLHLAAAVGTPGVAMFGPTRPEKSGPYGKQHICLQRQYQGGTSRQRRGSNNEAMRAIDVEMVTYACDQILARGEKTRRTFAA